MNRIERLIKEYCPEGVEFIKLKNVANIGTGNTNGNEATEDGKYPLYVRSKLIKRIDIFEFNEEAIIIPGEGGIGEIFHYINGKYALHQRAYRINIFDKNISTKFIYYFMKSNFKVFIQKKAVNATVTSIRKPMIEDFQIPIPPLPIQQEIANILDNFTQLEAELEAELEARRKQYEFYLNQLMEFEGKDVEWKALGDLAKIGDGLHGTPKYSLDGNYFFINGNNLVNGSVKYFESTKRVDDEMYKKHGINFIENKTVFLSINGTIGSLAIYKNEKIVLGKSVSYFNIEDDVLNPKFLYYYFQGNHSKYYFENKRTGSTIKNLGLGALRAFEIPVPPIEEQERIVSILDQFDALVNDTTIGLQAEIASRRKQYEYYRNKLLTFEEYE